MAAYNVLNEIHYKFYQFHSNAAVALLFVYVARRFHAGFFATPFGWFDVGFLLLAVILFAGSRDTLRKYYSRVSQLLGSGTTGNEARPMWNNRRSREQAALLSDATHRHRGPHNPSLQRSSKNRSSFSLGR